MSSKDPNQNINLAGRILLDYPPVEVIEETETILEYTEEEVEEMIRDLESFDEVGQSNLDAEVLQLDEETAAQVGRRLSMKRIPCISHKVRY